VDIYGWIKAVHIIAVIAWMAGMLYLPRLFVYHCAAEKGSVQSETFKVMERRLLRGIINPAMIATWVLGLYAAILFSDILVVPYALGQHVTFAAGEGPRLDALTDPSSRSRQASQGRRSRKGRAPFQGGAWASVACHRASRGSRENARRGARRVIHDSSCAGLTRVSMLHRGSRSLTRSPEPSGVNVHMDRRVTGERGDAVLRMAMPGNDQTQKSARPPGGSCRRPRQDGVRSHEQTPASQEPGISKRASASQHANFV
jgi:hypothetical protein